MMKKILFLTICTVFTGLQLFGQTLATPEFTYLITDAQVDCDNNKVCYTVSVKSNLTGPYYYDGATFRYFVDPDIFEQPVAGDHTIIPTFSTFPVYTYTQQAVEQPTYGVELGYENDDTYWVKGTLAASLPQFFPRVEVGTEPVELMTICLTAVNDLSTEGSSLCYPFIFDENHINTDNGIPPNTEGLQTSYTEVANVAIGGGGAYAAYDNAEQYIWEPNASWDGQTITNQPAETVGSIASTGCLENSCSAPPCTIEPSDADPTPTYVGISTLQRNVEEWLPQDLSAYIVLESSKKGFVITRNADPDNTINSPEVGMIVWDSGAPGIGPCLNMYFDRTDDNTDNPTWNCINDSCNPNP